MSGFGDRLLEHGILRTGDDGTATLRLPFMPSRRAMMTGALAAILAPVAARAAETIKMMAWQGYEDGLADGGFLEKNGLTIASTYMADNNQIITTATAGGTGSMQIISPDTAYTPFMAEIDILEPLDMAKIPNFAKLFPRFRSMPGTSIGGRQYSLPYVWGSIPLMFNPAKVGGRPTSWLDLLDERYRGKVAVTNDIISVIVPFTLAATGTRTPTRITAAELEKTIALLIRLKREQLRTVAPGYGELADLFASGEIVMAQGWEPVALWSAEKGVKLDWLIPKEGTHTLCDCLAVVKGAPNLDKVHAVINHGLSPGAQALTANKNATGVTVAEAVPLLEPRVRDIYPYADVDGYFQKNGGGPFPLWPIKREGNLVSMDDVLDGWERFLKA